MEVENKTTIEPMTGRPSTLAEEIDQLGDHLAINFVNTSRMSNGKPLDRFQCDDDVRAWLTRLGVPVASAPASWPDGALLKTARRLRQVILEMVEAIKAGTPPALEPLNEYLVAAVSHGALVALPDATVEFRRIYHGATPEEYLAPIAESAADLLAHGDLGLIRQCEGPRCILWFYDRTKSHHRRWCRAAGCGNRAKVAAFRARKREQ